MEKGIRTAQDTPFSLILFYELVLLVFALAASYAGEIAKQYQIVSPIVVRRVFQETAASANGKTGWLNPRP